MWKWPEFMLQPFQNDMTFKAYQNNHRKRRVQIFRKMELCGNNFLPLFLKLRLHEQFFTSDRNAVFRNYSVAIALKNCNPATRCDGKICWQINCQNIKSLQYFGNFSEDVALPAQDMLHMQFFPPDDNAIISWNCIAIARKKLRV